MTEIRRNIRLAPWMALLALLPLMAMACTADEEETPDVRPGTILSEAETNSRQLESYHFNGEVVMTERDESGDAVDLFDPDGTTGEASGDWEEGTGWAAEVFGFGRGRGTDDRITAVSNGQSVLVRESPDDDWRQPDDLQVEIPTPDKWLFVFDLDNLNLKADDNVVNGEEVYHFGGTRFRDVESLPPIFQDTPVPTNTVGEAYDIYISKDDLQLVRLIAVLDLNQKSQIRTWNFSRHNADDIDIDLPDELTELRGA